MSPPDIQMEKAREPLMDVISIRYGWLFISSLGLLAFLLWFFNGSFSERVLGQGILLTHGTLKEIVTLESGFIESYEIVLGDVVLKGDIVAHLRPFSDPKKTIPIVSNFDGIVSEFLQFAESEVKAGKGLLLLTPKGDVKADLKLIAFVAASEGKLIKPLMRAYILPSTSAKYEDGFLLGTVDKVANLPTGKSVIKSLIRIPELVESIQNKFSKETFYVVISPLIDPKHITGYKWSGPGAKSPLDSGTLAQVLIEYEQKKPYQKVFSFFLNLIGDPL